jgi:DNA-binding transcriptional LysR family regulator
MADLDLLRSFLAVYRAGSFSRAASAARRSQPALSQQLKALEAQVGRPLFTRGARGVAPTPAGQELARAAAPHLDALEAAVDSVRAGGSALGGTLFLGGPAELCTVRALPALAPLVSAGVQLVARFDVVGPLLEALAAGELDLVIATRKIGARGITYSPLCDELLVLVASPTVAEQLPSRGPEALLASPLLAYSEDLPLIRRFMRDAFGARVSARPAVIAPDLRAVMSLAIAGAGLTVLPRYLCAGALARGELVELVRAPRQSRNTLWLATGPARGAAPRVHAAAEHLRRAAVAW